MEYFVPLHIAAFPRGAGGGSGGGRLDFQVVVIKPGA